MNGFVYSGGLVPNMGRNTYQGMSDMVQSSYNGGDPGLNYRFLSVPEDNENNYSGYDVIKDELNEEANFTLFPCRKQCKEELGGKGAGFRECLRACRGKGLSKSQIKTKDLELQEKAVAALTQPNQSGDSSRISDETGKTKKTVLIISGVILLVGIIVAVILLTRKKAEE